MPLWFCVAVRIVANPFSNVLQKLLARGGADPLGVILVAHGLLSAVCLPAAFGSFDVAPEFWTPIVASACFAVAANALIVAAVRISDLSVLGPINAYKSIVSLVPGFVLLGEVPSPLGLAGMVAIVGGSYLLTDGEAVAASRGGGFAGLLRDRGVRYRFAALLLSATEAVFLKQALRAASPATTFAAWSILGFVVALVVEGARGGRRPAIDLAGFRAGPLRYLLLTATTGLMQFTTLVALTGLQVGYSLALFQTSAVLSVVLGYAVFQERHFFRRLVGSAVMAGGAALIILGR